MAEQQSNENPLETHEVFTKQFPSLSMRRSQDFISVYGSHIGMMSSQWDISFSIGQPMTDDPNNIYIEQRALVTLSFQTAKSLVALLASIIQSYERQFGEINLISLPTQPEQPHS